ncbi:LysR family transcriptional regulator [Acinetobacter baumannii]|nr:LysR family transcriptional regulator [Acinetobacter baumannii]MDC4563242.1 LysR family transcriptional regulator [Acinetobacter baumannii]MDC4764369.1 LysR family transcriptional regulator [Acinetobacter baumannii]MDC4859248.1 LysR family transcriptional regulator [Acinetobacter baumannii]MDC4875836.1 LysR family transcriptional regulator [Acinetobacter baumannii]
MIERISLNSLKFFYFVAKYGSVTLAAKKLFVTQSAVSKQIYNLEEALNTTLFDRKNKTLVMTKQGEILLSCCHQVFGQLDECLIQLSQPKTENKQLVLSCEPTLSMKWLIPRLSKFKKLGHDFEVVLLTAGGVVDFEKDNIDIAIRRNDFDWGEHIYSEKIADEYIALVQATQSLETNDVLISTSRPNFFKSINRIAELKQSLKGYTKVELEHFYLCLEGCLAGLGATVISIYMIEKELEWKVLQKNSPVVQDGSAYFLLSHRAFEEDPRKTIFLEWLKAEMNESQHKLL